MSVLKKRKKPPPRKLAVIRKQTITPHMVRVTIGGKALHDFPVDQVGGYVKLLLQQNGVDCMRTYTVRDFKPALMELDIDFVLHEATGPAAQWARTCEVADVISIAGPGPKKPLLESADWYLAVGDMSALPAISVNLESLSADARGYAILEVISPDDVQEFSVPENFKVEWIINPHSEHENTLLFDAVTRLDWLAGEPYTWVAGEFNQSIAIRNYLRKERGISRTNMYASSYWQIGQTEDGHKITKREYKDK